MVLYIVMDKSMFDLLDIERVECGKAHGKHGDTLKQVEGIHILLMNYIESLDKYTYIEDQLWYYYI